MERNLAQEIKVGIFVVVFMVLIAAGVFVLGGASKMFAQEYKLHTTFLDVKGLKTGAVVRLAGIDIGEVSNVQFSSDQGTKTIEVELTIRSEYQPRLRADSSANISQIGVLGDMYISLSVGSPEKEMLAGDATISSVESVDYLSYANKATSIVENASSISKKLDLMLGSDEAAAGAGVANSLSHIEALLAEAKEGNGILHILIYDKSAGAKVKDILAHVDGIVTDVHALTTEMRTGKGLAHEIVYSPNGEKLFRKLGDMADAVDGVMGDIKTGDSLAHALLYDPEKAKIIDDVQRTMAHVEELTNAVNEGDGTLGLLVRDPQLYEDMRVLLGGAQRNALLKAYIRATVAKGRNESEWEPPSDDPETGGR
ncbi:MAG: MCE family protein [Myxococcales bacterium]|nr:MCE family protein [Myxococcales bacterium]